MGPAIALRLRQHLTLTPQVQQALKLLQMSALEFQQEMDQALSANPFLEDNAEQAAQPASAKDAAPESTPAPEPVAEPRVEPEADVPMAYESSASGSGERDQEDWGGMSDAEP